jgi:hypothetical protein
MQEGQNARQQVVERIRQSTSILVAVGNNPSVDALAASLGLSLMLNKMNKHATAVFSGQTPEVIQFLEPNKTFETNVDALRDFIISLDKEKADRLRYKVEDDVVRIFITPYKTSITDKDLQFSQGDFNVDLIIALGVEKREDLDKAIVAHGRILHDATVITINADNQRSTLGSIDYNDAAASSLCEMLVSMSEAFQQPGILDAQISTALLTGIVANTDRFSNPRTSPRVMTMAAQLMAAGANQQLIATNLEKAKAITTPAAPGPMAKQQASAAPAPMQEESPKPKKEPGELDIVHEKPADKPAPAPAPTPAAAVTPPAEPEITAQQEKELEEALPAPQVQHNLLPEVKEELANTVEEEKPAGAPAEGPKAPGSESVNDPTATKKEDGEGDYISSHGSWKGKRLEPPTLGGTLNATTEEAHEASVKAEEADRNQKLLTHPTDSQPSKSKRSRNRKGKGNNNSDVPAAAAAPVVAAAATPVLPAAPAPVSLPPAPEPVIEQPSVVSPEIPPMPPQPEAAPVAPETPAPIETPAPAPEPTPAPLPPLPAAPELPPEPAPAPIVEPAPAPVAAPEPVATPELPVEPLPPLPAPAPQDDLEALHQEVADSAAAAAAVAQPAESTAGDLDDARAAVSQALDAQPFNPAGQPLESVGAQPMPGLPAEPVAPQAPEPAPMPAPMPDPLQSLPPAPVADAAPAPVNAPLPAAPPSFPGLPPLPPMPPMPDGNAELPPAPDLPGLNAPLPPISNDAPVADPAAAPPAAPSSDPAQFKIPGA